MGIIGIMMTGRRSMRQFRKLYNERYQNLINTVYLTLLNLLRIIQNASWNYDMLKQSIQSLSGT